MFFAGGTPDIVDALNLGMVPGEGTKMNYQVLLESMTERQYLTIDYLCSLRKECEERIRENTTHTNHIKLMENISKLCSWYINLSGKNNSAT